ncbi:MAG: glycosyltransferase family 2 protein [Candidatus Acidiferrum sp.]
MASVRFSIIITFHNQGAFIHDALESALSQRHANYEIIVVDDASTDGSVEILKQYADKITVERLVVNRGACGARNRGAALASGEYLVFLDGDDAFLPWALEVYQKIVEAKKPAMVLALMSWFTGRLPAARMGDAPKEITVVDYSDYLRRDRTFGHSASSMVFTREAFANVGGWLEGFFPAEDYDMALRLGVSGRTILILSPATILHRAHASNTINSVSSFVPALKHLLHREKLGYYPGGATRSFERRALIGQMVFHWTKRAARSGLYGNAIDLQARSSQMFLASISRKLGLLLFGKQPAEIIKMRN